MKNQFPKHRSAALVVGLMFILVGPESSAQEEQDKNDGPPAAEAEKQDNEPEISQGADKAGDPANKEQLAAEQQKHFSRMIKIRRLRAMAEETKNEKVLEMIKTLRKTERKRHRGTVHGLGWSCPGHQRDKQGRKNRSEHRQNRNRKGGA